MVDEKLSEERREELLERISRRGATIGERIPETVSIDGEDLHLKAFVWETKQQGFVPAKHRDRVQRVRSKLKAERDRRKEQLATAELTTATAETLTESIIGIDRAITALKSLREPDLESHSHDQYVQGNKRWLAFLEKLR